MKKLLFILSCVSIVFAQSNDFSFYSNEKNINEFSHINKDFINKDFESILRFNPIFFNSTSNTIKEKSQDYLIEDVLTMVKKYENDFQNATINIIGYTDLVQTKTEKVNQSWWFPSYPNDLTLESSHEIALSYAQYVKEQLMQNGIPEEIINIVKGGDRDPLYVGVNDETRELNYRAMVTMYLEKDIDADSDNDGVIDSKDNCPYTPAGHSVNEFGCSELLNLTIYYNVNSAVIRDDSFEKLTTMIVFMNKYPDYKVVLYGHTSSEGTKLNNQILSEKRALSIRKYLIEQGISSSRISVYGKGSTQPIQSEDVAEIPELNRRVEIKLQ